MKTRKLHHCVFTKYHFSLHYQLIYRGSPHFAKSITFRSRQNEFSQRRQSGTEAAALPAVSDQKASRTPGAESDKEWLRRLLETKTGGFRNAIWRRCNKCDDITIHGMDADLCAGMVTVDPAPLSPQQEMWCAVQGRPTYSLDIDSDRKIKINDRVKYSLAKPHPHGRPIVAAHKCGERYSGFIPELKKPTTATGGDKPPF